MQAPQATTVAVRLQPLAYMTQFLHTNINRTGIFHLTTSSVEEGLQFRPDYSSIRRKQNHLTPLFSVGCFFLLRQCWQSRSLARLRRKLWQASTEWQAKTGPSLKLHAYKSRLPTEASIQQILLVRKDISLTVLIYPGAENWRHSGERSLIVY